jgi:hypothetical protein
MQECPQPVGLRLRAVFHGWPIPGAPGAQSRSFQWAQAWCNLGGSGHSGGGGGEDTPNGEFEVRVNLLLDIQIPCLFCLLLCQVPPEP